MLEFSAMRSVRIAVETRRPTFRRASFRSSERSSSAVVKKSIVPITLLSTMIGKHMADRRPCFLAIGDLKYPGPVIAPKSGRKTRSRVFQAPPQSPSPSRIFAPTVAPRNSSAMDPDSIEVWSTCSASIRGRYEPYSQPKASRTPFKAVRSASSAVAECCSASTNVATAWALEIASSKSD